MKLEFIGKQPRKAASAMPVLSGLGAAT